MNELNLRIDNISNGLEFSSLQETKKQNKQINNQNYSIFEYEISSLVNEINNIIKKELKIEEQIEQVFLTISKVIKYKSYFVSVYENENLFYEYFNNCDNGLRDRLKDYGMIKIASEEKKSLIIPDPENNQNKDVETFLIISVFSKENLKTIFCINVEGERTEFINNKFSLIEMILNLLSYSILVNLTYETNKLLKSEITQKENFIKNELSFSAVGKICSKSFHNLKNRTQVLVTSFNLLQKLIPNQFDERLDKIFSILNKEIPEFSRAIKGISEFSRNILSTNTLMYFEFDRLIYEVLDFLKISGIDNTLKLEVKNLTQSKIFGYYNKLSQAILLLIMELINMGINDLKLSTNEDALRVNLKLHIHTDDKQVINLLNESSNINFVQIKSLFKSNACNVFSKNFENYIEIMVSLPKRSSQFKLKDQKNV